MARTSEGFRRQYWDTCLFINYLTNQEKDKADVVHDLLVQAEKGKPPTGITIVISSLVIAEVREKAGNVKERQEKIERLFDTRRSGALLKYDEEVGDPPLKIETPWIYSGAMDAELKRRDEERP